MIEMMPDDGETRKKRTKPRKYNLNIPSVFEVFNGSAKENGFSDMPVNTLFLPNENSIKMPVAIDTSKMALRWARGKL